MNDNSTLLDKENESPRVAVNRKSNASSIAASSPLRKAVPINLINTPQKPAQIQLAPKKLELSHLSDICALLGKIQTRLDSYNEVVQNLAHFQHNFGSFIQAVKIQRECLQFPVVPPEQFRYDDWTIMKEQMGKLQLEQKEQQKKKALREEKVALPEPIKVVPQEATTSHSSATASTSAGFHPTKTPVKAKAKNDMLYFKKIMQKVPMKYKEPEHKRIIEGMIRFMRKEPMGQYFTDIVAAVQTPKTKCTEYLNILLRNDDVKRISRKGLVYQINLDKYPYN